MNWLREFSNILTALDNWMNLTYFDAIDLIETREDLNRFTNGQIQLSPLTNIDQYNLDGLQPLHYAIQSKNNLAIEWLLFHQQTVYVNSLTENEGRNSAHCAVKVGDSDPFEKLVRLGVNLNALDRFKMTPLAYAETDLNAENWLPTTLINTKIRLGDDQRTYFHYFARDSTQSLLDYLIRMNFEDINTPDIHGTTPVMIASETGQLEALWKLLSNGAKLDSLDEEGRNALHRAAAVGQSNACKLLLYIPDILPANDRIESEYYTEIDDVTIGRMKSEPMLLIQDSQFLTPLMAAVFNGHPETVRILVNENKEQLDCAQESTGNTALHLAVLMGSPAMVSVILEAGAYPDPVNKSGKKPIQLAPEGSEIYQLLSDI